MDGIEMNQSEKADHVLLKYASLFMLCLAMVGGLHAAASGAENLAAAEPTVSFMPLESHLQPGGLCTLQVVVDDAVDSLSCMEVYITYDAAYAECTKAIEGRLFTQSGYPTFFQWHNVTPDTATAVDCLLGYRSYFLAPGELVRFVFRAKVVGICRVYFAAQTLWDIDRVKHVPVPGQHAEIIVSVPTSGGSEMPRGSALFNYPNPFNPTTTLVLWLPNVGGERAQSHVSLNLCSPGGLNVRALFEGTLPPGRKEFMWDGKDDRGNPVAAGIYFAIAQTTRGILTRKLVLIR
jgi:hypothetical protein